MLYKKEGETPLMVLEKFNKKHPKYREVSLTYAGRLDPMASGVLLVLAGPAIKEKEKYLALKKEYYFSVLLGFATDTHDILGKITDWQTENDLPRKEQAFKIDQAICVLKKSKKQEYPMYSSKTVKGMPLFSYARENKKVVIPWHPVAIEKFRFLKMRKIKKEVLQKNIERRIQKIKGDFRQKEILLTWKKALLKTKKNQWYIADFMVQGSSGLYVRKLADDLGKILGVPALALSIKRTKVGNYRLT